MARYVGVPVEIANLLPTLALAAGIVAIALLRRRPDRAFVVAVVTLVFGSPTVNINWFALLFAALAPLAWPLRDSRDLDLLDARPPRVTRRRSAPDEQATARV
jgi:hypothetical protein